MCDFHARIQKVLSEGSKFDNVFFLVDEGYRIQIPLIIQIPLPPINGSLSARQRNAI